MEAWALALLIVAAVIVGGYLLRVALRFWAERAYRHILQHPRTYCDIDAFVNAPLSEEEEEQVQRNPVDATKVVMIHKFRLGNREASLEPIPLETTLSTHVDGLLVSRRAGTANATSTTTPQTVRSLEQVLAETSPSMPIVIATIRMGFGHHRIAYAACSWALQAGRVTLFHDLLNIQPSAEAALIKSTDELYSKFSRYASEMGGPVERLWGSLMLSGDANALRVAALTAAHLQPLLLGLPKDIPMITTHQLVALTASAAGFTRVYNLVVDNHPQWFLTVPRTVNLVQGPVNYQAFLRMGIPPSHLQWAGHWCPAELVLNIPNDCQGRLARTKARGAALAHHKTTKTTGPAGQEMTNLPRPPPLRLLIPVGGAGAQRKFIVALVRALAPWVHDGRVQLLLNAGDHVHMKEAFLQVLDECRLTASMETVTDTAGVRAFQERLLYVPPAAGAAPTWVEPTKPVTLFCFEEYFPAVATTDLLCRVAEVLCCKPSELAFYCVPKLHIRRVGDHEADSAQRASELGDGTLEAREVPDALAYLRLFLQGPDLLTAMNQAILHNHEMGIYNGCKNAVAMALADPV